MTDFDDLLDANQRYAKDFAHADLQAPAAAKVAVVTCMDSRIDPLAILGLGVGDAKVLRTPGGRVDHTALEGVVLAVNLLGAERVMILEHTKCAMASNDLETLRDKVTEASGEDATFADFHPITDQDEQLADDVQKVRTHPLVPEHILVGGFVYDVETGLIAQRY